jgi:ADP-ribosylglycohydrolase
MGGAIGDALGYPVEFLSTMRIKKNYGEEGIRSLKINNGVAYFSDDTQMTLFTAEGLLKAKERGVTLKKSIYLSYLDWLKTQYEVSPVSDKGLLSVATLYDRRAPGITCLSALNSGLEGGISQSINDSKGCGGVMRTAPVALFCYARGANALGADELAAEAAAITHSHVLGHLPSYALNHILYEILGGADLSDAINRAIEATETRYACDEGAALGISKMRIASMLGDNSDMDDETAILMLGGGWVAEEALAISIYCALKYKDSFLDAVAAAVNHDGDSDSTGAITGNIIGAYLGYEAIPGGLSEPIEARDVILNMADALL